MSVNASSNQATRSSSVLPNRAAGGAPSTSYLPGTRNVPALSQRVSGNGPGNADADSGLTSEQRNSLKVLCEEANTLRWPARGDGAAKDADVLGYFDSLRAQAAQLHQVHQQHPGASQLAGCIKALEGALGRIDTALQRGDLDAETFDMDALKTVFGALSALADPARAPLFNRNQRRALQPLLQGLTRRLLLAHKAGFASAASAGNHLPLLNWICRGVKKGLLRQDADIAALFEAALAGLAGWIVSEDQDANSYQIGECAAILNTVIEYDLLLLKANQNRAAELSEMLSRCALRLCSDETFTLLEKPPVNGVAVVNLGNLVKGLIEAGALSFENPQLHAQLQRLLTLMICIPNETMSGGDGRVLSNVGNFLRMLMQHQPTDDVAGKPLAGMVATASRRVLAALNAEGFGRGARNAQSLSNLASFAQDCHRHLLTEIADERLDKSYSEALPKLITKIVATGAAAFDDRRAIDGLLAALEYLWSQGLCEGAGGLQALCAELRRKQAELGREKTAAPVQLHAMDAALPALTTAPKLTNPAAPAADAKPRRIPGDGAIVAPPKTVEGARIVPGTTHARARVASENFAEPSGRRQFKAGKVKPDALSIAARIALRDDSEGDDDASDEESEPVHAPGEPATHGRPAAAGKKRPGRTSGSASVEPKLEAKTITADLLVAAMRAGDATQVEHLMQQCKHLPQRQAPALPQAFLDEIARGDFLAQKPRFKAFNTYLSNLSKADRPLLIDHFAKPAPIVAMARQLLGRHGIIAHYGIEQYPALLQALMESIQARRRNGDELVQDALARVLARADEACIRKLASEPEHRYLFFAAGLMSMEEEAPLGWFLSSIANEALRSSVQHNMLCSSLLTENDRAAIRLSRYGGASLLRKPVTLLRIAARGVETPVFNFPMYAIAHNKRAVLKAMFKQAPEVFAARYAFGFSVLSAALLKDDADILNDLLAWLSPDVVDALASEPELPADEARFRKPGVGTIRIAVDDLSGFTLGHMPGFNALACACAIDATSCVALLLSHEAGRLARQRSIEEWQAVLDWPDLRAEIREMLETFLVEEMCRCVAAHDLDRLAHWMLCGQSLFSRDDSAANVIKPLRLAIETGEVGLAALLLDQASRAHLVSLGLRAGMVDWASVFPGIDQRMLGYLTSAEERINAQVRAAPAHSSAAASSRAPQSLQ